MSDSAHSQIAMAVRKQVCLTAPEHSLMLSESDLAAQFGVSRTPIRQVLQQLSFEHLVEIRSGVGSCAPALAPEAEPHDMLALRGLCKAARPLEEAGVSLAEQSALRGLSVFLRKDATLDADALFDLGSTLVTLMAERCPDPILRSAITAAAWRALRWCLPGLCQMSKAQRRHIKAFMRQLEQQAHDPDAKLFDALLAADLALFSDPPKGKSAKT